MSNTLLSVNYSIQLMIARFMFFQQGGALWASYPKEVNEDEMEIMEKIYHFCSSMLHMAMEFGFLLTQSPIYFVIDEFRFLCALAESHLIVATVSPNSNEPEIDLRDFERIKRTLIAVWTGIDSGQDQNSPEAVTEKAAAFLSAVEAILDVGFEFEKNESS